MFQSTPSGGKATHPHARNAGGVGFQSTPSGGKATQSNTRAHRGADVSIHAFRGEGDKASRNLRSEIRGFNPRLPGGRRRRDTSYHPCVRCFNPRLPGGRRQATPYANLANSAFQSTPSGGKATTRSKHPSNSTTLCFNPRLPGGRRRAPNVTMCANRRCFNPRLPGGRRHAARWPFGCGFPEFQSTPSGGKATGVGEGV